MKSLYKRDFLGCIKQRDEKLNTKEKKKIFLLTVLGFIGCIFIVSCVLWINPVNRADFFLKRGNCKQVVSIINKGKLDKNGFAEVKPSIEKYMDQALSDWNGEIISYEDANNIFVTFSDIMDDDISRKANEYEKFIQIENDGNKIIEKAEKDYENGHYINAMQKLEKVDQSYSQYEVVVVFYDECKDILLQKVGNPETISDYEKNIKLLDSYIKEVDDRDFVNAKNTLEKELKEYQDIYHILTDATEFFEKKSYKNTFSILNQGKEKYPDNKKIEYALSAYQYSYVLDITSQVITFADEDDYDSAESVLEDAIETYDCEAFEDLLHETKMKTSLLYAAESKLKDAGSYVFLSAKKMVLGDFAEDEQETLLSMGGSVAASIANVDAPLDVRDLAYDLTHWGEGDYFGARLALDAVGILPVIGALKYIKHVDTVADTVKTADKIADSVDTAHDIAKAADAIIDSGKTLDNISDAVGIVADVKKKAETVLDLTDDYSDFAKKTEKVVDAGKDVIHYTPYKTINQVLEGKVFPGTDIKFIRKNLDLSDGRHLTGVFPKFKSYTDIQLPDEYIKVSFNKQKTYLSKQLKKMAETTSGKKQLKKIFTEDELKEIAQGIIPNGYVWHHNETEGMMQLVKETDHAKVRHTGGMSIWGEGYK